MKKRLQGFVGGVLAVVLLFSGYSFAKSAVEKIEVRYDNIQIFVDNVQKTFKDAEGRVVEPFVYNGTTYIPLRAAAELTGMQVEWKGETKSIYLWDKKRTDKDYLFKYRTPHAGDHYGWYSKDKTLSISGIAHTNALYLAWIYDNYSNSYTNAFLNLNGEFTKLDFVVGTIANTKYKEASSTFQVFLDDKLVYEKDFKNGDTLVPVSLDVTGGLKLEFKNVAGYKDEYGRYYSTGIGIGEISVEK